MAACNLRLATSMLGCFFALASGILFLLHVFAEQLRYGGAGGRAEVGITLRLSDMPPLFSLGGTVMHRDTWRPWDIVDDV